MKINLSIAILNPALKRSCAGKSPRSPLSTHWANEKCDYLWDFFLATLMASLSALASEKNIESNKFEFPMPTISTGFSYPLIFSYSAGAFFPLGKQEANNVFPSVPSLRADAEIGIGGGSVDVGIYFPVDDGSFAINLKASRMRTWLVKWNQPINTIYDGVIAELVTLGHVPGKICLGYFIESEAVNNQRNSFIYLFVCVGW